ncbi:MAG: hypothetical protein ABIX01_22255 [Chitinophagaceae bacterium]
MFALLHQYLIENSKLHLPGIGTLEFAELPGRLEVADKLLMAPKKILRLNNAMEPGNKHGLMGFLSRTLNISEEHAYSVFQQFMDSVRNTLGTKRILYWDNLGAFQKDETGTIQFVQTSDIDQYTPPVSAERMIRQNAEHSMKVGETETTNTAMQEYYHGDETEPAKKDYWWVWAIVIFACSSVLIWLKHFS